MNILMIGEKILPLRTEILNILVVLAGIWFLRKVLLSFFSNRITTFTLFLIIFGTNYFQLILGSSPFPNNLLFTLFSVVLWLNICWHENPSWPISVLLGLSLGLTIMVNVSDWVIIFIPVFWGVYDYESLKAKGRFLKRNLFKALVCSDAMIAILVLLFIFWNSLSAFFGYIGYSQHGVFYMVGIYFPQVMFSWKNGWFVYAPLMIFAIAGFYFLAARKPGIYYSTFLYFFVNLIILCSWSTYPLNDEFGRKMLVQSMAVLSIPLGYLLQSLSEKKLFISIPFYLILSFFVLLNLFQTWQYRTNILDPYAMKDNYYWAVFGRTHVPEEELLELKGFDPDVRLFLKDESRFNVKVLAFYDFEDTTVNYRNNLDKKFVKNGKMSFRLDTVRRFSPGITISYGDLTKFPRVGIRISANVFVNDTSEKIPASMVVSSKHEGSLYHYWSLNFEELKLKPESWNKISQEYLTPEDPAPGDLLIAYVYYRGRSKLYVDDVKIELFEPKE